MLVAVLIGIMISIVVGVALVPTIVSTTSNITYTVANATASWTTYAPTGVQSLADVLPYIFVAVILLGAVAWIGGQG